MWLQSVRQRPAAVLAILLLAAGAVLVSATTPMLLTASNTAVLRERVASAPVPGNGVSVVASASGDAALPLARRAIDAVLAAAARSSDRLGAPSVVAEPQVVPRLIGPGGRSLAEEKTLGIGGPASVRAGLAVAPTRCDGLVVTGSCPTTSSDALIAMSLSRSTGWGAGTTLRAETGGGSLPIMSLGDVSITGVYDDARGAGRVLADPTQLLQTAARRAVPELVIGSTDLDRWAAPIQLSGLVRVDRPVAPGDVEDLFRAAAAAKRVALSRVGAVGGATVSTGLPALLSSVKQEQSAATVLAAPVGLEAVLLAWFALFVVARRAARARAVEWGVGRMRGSRPLPWLASVLGEPLVAVVTGSLLGGALAVGIALIAAPLLVGSATAVSPFSPFVSSAFLLTVAGSLLVLVAATAGTAVQPLSSLLQRGVERRRLSRTALVVQAVVLAAAAAIVFNALTAAQLDGPQLGLLLPAAAALVAAIIAVQLVVVLMRRAVRRPPRSLSTLLVGRGLARAPSALQVAQLVLVSAALAAFALQLAATTTTAQTARARMAVGAGRVLSVQAPDHAALLTAVRAADPGGRTAMAVEEVTGTPGRAGGKVLAVDAERLAAIGFWDLASPGRVDPRRLVSAAAPTPEIRGSVLRVDVRGRSGGFRDVGYDPFVHLRAVLATTTGWRTVDLGVVYHGAHRAAVPCTAGCRLVAFQLDEGADSGDDWSVAVTIHAVSTDQQASTALAPLLTGHWRQRQVDQFDPTGPATARATVRGGVLRIAAENSNGGSVLVEPGTGSGLVPAITGSAAALEPFPGLPHAALGTSLAAAPILLRPIGTVVAVPAALRTGVLVDLGTLLRTEDPAAVTATEQVWLTPGPHAAVLASLRRAGVRILGEQTAADAERAALRSATERSVLVAAVAAVVAVLFGLLAFAAARVVDLPLARRDLTVLGISGVRPRTLRRVVLIQTALPPVVAILVGVVVGTASAVVLSARLPLLTGSLLGPLLDTGPSFLLLLALTAAAILLAVVVAGVLTAVETRPLRAGRSSR